MSSHVCGISLSIVAIALAATVTNACAVDQSDPKSGYSGVGDTKYIDELSETELLRLCSWSIPRVGGAGNHDCGDGTVIIIKPTEECAAGIAATAPHCQVSLFEACVLSLDGDACLRSSTAACQSYDHCEESGAP
jgi:hypothetical protein